MSDIERIERGFADDQRGSLEFYNDLDLSNYKRFYIVHNPNKGTVRAWHGHKKEGKLLKVIKGSFLVGVVKIDNWDNPKKDVQPESFEMNRESDILFIPPGYANGAMNVLDDSSVMYFSTSNLEESMDDDFRFDSKYWDLWTDKGGVLFE